MQSFMGRYKETIEVQKTLRKIKRRLRFDKKTQKKLQRQSESD